jgi:hypothetical protein
MAVFLLLAWVVVLSVRRTSAILFAEQITLVPAISLSNSLLVSASVRATEIQSISAQRFVLTQVN